MLRQLLFLMGLVTTTALQAWTVQSAYAQTMTTADFQRLGEFLTGDEVPGHRSILRSQPTTRDGCYIVLKLNEAVEGWPTATTVVLEVIPTGAVEAQIFRFARPTGEMQGHSLWLGLTGSDWPGPRVQPLAWRVRWIDANDQIMTEWASFLWSADS